MASKNIKSTSLEEFYREASGFTGKEITALLPPGINKEIGHFNIFDIAETIKEVKRKSAMPYNRRAYYKISLICGKSTAEYADKTIDITHNALLFATPKVPYNWVPKTPDMHGVFCIFTEEFLAQGNRKPNELPIFSTGSIPVFMLNDNEADEIAALFNKMKAEIASDYTYKYELLRTYVWELIHYGQKLQPASATPAGNAGARVAALFLELLERQFPIEFPRQTLALRTAKDFADRLSIHVNYLNKVLKDATGKTTMQLIAARLVIEAKILLKQTNLNISEIAYGLGFEDPAHFSNFFKKHTELTPAAFRS